MQVIVRDGTPIDRCPVLPLATVVVVVLVVVVVVLDVVVVVVVVVSTNSVDEIRILSRVPDRTTLT
jgi:hypothetical protein